MTLGLRRNTAGNRSSVEGDRPDTTADDETVVDQDQGNGMRCLNHPERGKQLNGRKQSCHTSSASCDQAPTSAE